jgi:MoaA/NifB/PqqE/SkfB family radical SAM enzyme
MLDALANKPLKTEFTTNGTMLMQFPPEEILRWHIDILGISIDGFDAEAYSRYRPKGNYDVLRAKVIEFFKVRKKMRCRFPQIRIRSVVFPDTTPKQIEAFTETWLPFADVVMFNTLISRGSYKPTEKFERCEDILFTIHVRWDGRVPLCGYQLWCGDVEWLGNIHDSSLRNLWHTDRLLEVSKRHAAGDFTEIEFCKNCFYTQGRKRILDIAKTYDTHRNRMLSKLYRLAIGLEE